MIRYFRASHNSLSGTLPSGLFQGLSSLAYVTRAPVERIRISVASWVSSHSRQTWVHAACLLSAPDACLFRSIELKNNSFSGTLPPELFRKLPSLQYVKAHVGTWGRESGWLRDPNVSS